MAGVLMLLLIGALAAGALVVSSRQTLRTVERWQARDECLLAAQTAMEKIKYNTYQGFNAYHENTFSWTNIYWLQTFAYCYSTNGGRLGGILGAGAVSPYSNALITATVTNSPVFSTNDTRMIYITNTVTATWGNTTRTIQETVLYTLNRSSVFDHAYFINNFGWFKGVNVAVNGNLRSNYNMELNSTNLVLNGSSYAFGENDILRPFKSWDAAEYMASTNSTFSRPFYYVDLNTNSSASGIYEDGYNPDDVEIYDHVDQLKMPFIGNLNDYIFYAQEKGGTIKTGNTIIVDAVYSTNQVGPSFYTNALTRTGNTGISNAADRGCLVLVGTTKNPIRINGPVVIQGDVIIKGYFTGQGTIYAGRNIHIIDSVIATNPPKWNHPDTVSNFNNTTLSNNLSKDFLGLCAKGSIVIGNYNTSYFTNRGGGVEKYIRPPFTSNYTVSVADADIGYVSGIANGTNYFNGDYTNYFGYKSSDSATNAATATNSVPRRYYESSLSNTNFAKLKPSATVNRIDAILYNNHLTCGRFGGASAMVNGGIICRDEALLPGPGTTLFNWDSRIAQDVDFKPYLPMSLSPAKTISWTELTP